MADTVMITAPVIVAFFFALKAFVEGVTPTGVKGQALSGPRRARS